MNKKIFKQDAKIIVDMMFDMEMFKGKITRDNMSSFQDLIEHLLSSKFKSHVKAQKLLESIQALDKKN